MAEGKVKLRSADGEMFEVEEEVANESATIRCMIEDTGTELPVPLPNVNSKILSKVRAGARGRRIGIYIPLVLSRERGEARWHLPSCAAGTVAPVCMPSGFGRGVLALRVLRL